jgi:uncharacterized caspase-like protein
MRRLIAAVACVVVAACARPDGAVPATSAPTAEHWRARSLPGSTSRFALVIGNQSYAAAPLASAHNDATAIASKLRQLGFETQLTLDATGLVFQRELRSFASRLKSAESIGLFYYAGHGVQIDGFNYLVPVDAGLLSREEVKASSVTADEVLAAMNDARSGVNLIFLDACRNDPFGRALGDRGERGLAMMNAPNSTLLAYATAPGMVAGEATPHGYYTGALLSYLTAPGATVYQVHRLAAAEVQRVTHGQQVPWLAMSLTSDVCLGGPCGGGPLTPAELFALASKDYLQGKLSSAIDLLMQALHGEPPLSPAQRSAAETMKLRAESRLGTIRLEVEPALATVLVDGEVRFSTAGGLQVDPGVRKIEIAETGYRSEQHTLQIEAGQVVGLRAALARLQPGQRDNPRVVPAAPATLALDKLGQTAVDEAALKKAAESLTGVGQIESATAIFDDVIGGALRQAQQSASRQATP